MSEPLEWDDACRWLELRKSAICAAWSKVFTDILGGQSGEPESSEFALMMLRRSKRGPSVLHVCMGSRGLLQTTRWRNCSLGVRPANSLNETISPNPA